MDNKDVKRVIMKAFSYLWIDYSFKTIEETLSRYSVHICAKNRTTGIVIDYDAIDIYLKSTIVRLVNSEFVDNSDDALFGDDIANSYGIDYIILYFNEHELIDNDSVLKYCCKDIKKYINYRAEITRKYAASFLNGDFTEMEGLHKYTKMKIIETYEKFSPTHYKILQEAYLKNKQQK